ncbi:hypothetical protein FRC98_10950 [Lujinxingia vulgaris]|uniref:Uncharacterized protein n=1 Tax=Lujinxingia vulgaris TaxID=2600176 RepID=A0A5C6X611_9DELT|nr:hypothetical protein [Lujinxingia vulgaris]TXD37240.1 hypothetical protein FRC98_10950 [Lujinxingia vulgaris]
MMVGALLLAMVPRASQAEPAASCEVVGEASGWIDLSCGSARVMVQSGPALSGSVARQFAYASDRIRAEIGGGVSGEDVRAQIGGQSQDAIAFVVRADRTSLLGYPMIDPEGEIRHRGLSAIIETPTHQRVRASCVMEASRFEARRCEAILGQLKERGINAPAIRAGDGVRVGGQRLALSSDCDVASSGRVVCDGGEFNRQEGDVAATAAAHREAIATMTRHNGQGGIHNPHTEHACTLLGQPATCHAVGWNGVTDTASHWLYSAHVERGASSVHLSCWFDAEEAMPSPCRDFFAEVHRAAGR